VSQRIIALILVKHRRQREDNPVIAIRLVQKAPLRITSERYFGENGVL
jgi:hypothetical protein